MTDLKVPAPRSTLLHNVPPTQRTTMWVVLGLLALQLIFLVGILVVTFGSLATARPLLGQMPTNSDQVLIAAFLFLPAALSALVGLIGIFLLRTVGWASAMLTQALLLSGALIYYFRMDEHPGLLYGLMAYGIVMVLYLNSVDVRTQFEGTADIGELDDGA